MIEKNRPIPEEAPTLCKYFFDLTVEDNLINSLESSKTRTLEIIKTIPPSLEEYRYAEGKWTIKMVLSHIIDCERHYSYYAMCYSRKDHKAYSDMERDLYAENSNANNRTLKEIEKEYLTVREATIKLFSYMTDDMLDFKSNANNFIYTPRSLGWMASGHNIHHCNLLEDRYLK